MSREKDIVVASKDAEIGPDGDNAVKTENGETYLIGSPVEKTLVRKFDTRLLPLLTLMYLFNSVSHSPAQNTAEH